MLIFLKALGGDILNYEYILSKQVFTVYSSNYSQPVSLNPLLMFCSSEPILQIKIFANRICSLFDQRNKRGISDFPCLPLLDGVTLSSTLSECRHV